MRGEPTLADLLSGLWAAKFHMLFFAAVFCAAAFFIVLLSTPLYRASMIVAPADGYALGDYASSVSEGEGLTIPFWRPREAGGISTDFHRFVYTVKGTAAAAILLKDSSVLSGIARDGSRASKADKWTPEELADYLDKKLRIEHLGATPLRRLSYKHPDPAFAAAFLRKIHLVADQLIRRDRRRQSESRIRYLTDTLQKTVNPDHRKGIANLLMQQEHIQMLANLDEPYAAIVVEPPAASPHPVWPAKSLFFSVFALLGAAIGYLVRSVRHER
ncbi:MAG TPA: Wzz/FepE/Etk N-terminal domain-containing protein [Micavibrio sp.]|nr:Wzz/FepE/Etk N-terminal domain-containing protein [Micavibrio sp.]